MLDHRLLSFLKQGRKWGEVNKGGRGKVARRKEERGRTEIKEGQDGKKSKEGRIKEGRIL